MVSRVLSACLLAALAGAALALTFPPTNLAWMLPLALAAFFVLASGLPTRLAWLPGLAFGLGFQVVLLFWMRALGTAPWLGLSLLETLVYGVLAAAVPTLRRLPAAPVWLAAAWVAAEYVRCTGPFGWMPWGRVSYAVVGTPLAPALPYLGSTGVSLVMALSGALLASVWWGRGRSRAWPVVGLLALVGTSLLPALAPYSSPPDGSAVVAAVQGNVPGDGTDVSAHFRQVTGHHLDVTRALARDVRNGVVSRPDLVVWPENSTAVDPFHDPQVRVDISAALHAVDVPILVGAVVDGGPEHVLNQGIVFDPVTGAGDRYTKWHPVAFGEYVPWRSVFGDHFAELRQVPRDMVAGTRTTPLSAGGIRVADAICFDVAYDDGIYAQIRNGGQLLVVQTSNALFIHTSQIDQQFAISRLRALETHRYVVVAAINGLTGVIAPDGSVVASLAPLTAGYLEQRVTLETDVTPAVRIGPWLGRVCVVLALVGWVVGLTRGRGRATRRSRGQYRRPSTTTAEMGPSVAAGTDQAAPEPAPVPTLPTAPQDRNLA